MPGLLHSLTDRGLVADGAMGTMLHAAGADCVETNMFGANLSVLGEYGISDCIFELSEAGARLAREVADPGIVQYRHNLKRDTLELPAGIVGADEPVEAAALRELEEETGHILAPGATLHALGPFYSLPSETNKYVHFFLATPVVWSGKAQGDTEIEKYFDMSAVEMPLSEALSSIGSSLNGLETAGALMLARAVLGADQP